ncbi:hypothetical protein HK102_000021 [Quaeritorhiza haematococci]|nr:hypothetical protein HK102_000021 [Quaeritorhiza haematococci]
MNAEYVVVSGARRKVETWAPEENETIALPDEKESEKLANNAFYKLEHGVADKVKAAESVPAITRLQQTNDKFWKDPYTVSQKLRKRFREEKKAAELVQKDSNSVRDKHCLSIDILPAFAEDADIAKRIKYEKDQVHIEHVEEKKKELERSSIFSKKTGSSSSTSKHVGGNTKELKGKACAIATLKKNIGSSSSASSPSSGLTFGHGLGISPDVVVVKRRISGQEKKEVLGPTEESCSPGELKATLNGGEGRDVEAKNKDGSALISLVGYGSDEASDD